MKKLISPLYLAGYILIGLQVTETISWSWFWVLSPFILDLVITFVLGVIVAAFMGRALGSMSASKNFKGR